MMARDGACAPHAGRAATTAASSAIAPAAVLRAPRLRGPIFRLDVNTDAAQEIRRQYAACIDDDRVVAQLEGPTRSLQDDRALLEPTHGGAEQHLEAPGPLGGLDALSVGRLGAVECLTAIG